MELLETIACTSDRQSTSKLRIAAMLFKWREVGRRRRSRKKQKARTKEVKTPAWSLPRFQHWPV